MSVCVCVCFYSVSQRQRYYRRILENLFFGFWCVPTASVSYFSPLPAFLSTNRVPSLRAAWSSLKKHKSAKGTITSSSLGTRPCLGCANVCIEKRGRKTPRMDRKNRIILLESRSQKHSLMVLLVFLCFFFFVVSCESAMS